MFLKLLIFFCVLIIYLPCENKDQIPYFQEEKDEVYKKNVELISCYKDLKDDLGDFINLYYLPDDKKLETFIFEKRDRIKKNLDDIGGVLIRNALGCETSFYKIFKLIFGNNFRFSNFIGDNFVRDHISKNTYSPNKVPNCFMLRQHNEHCYMKQFEDYIAFYCSEAPAPGEGATPLAKNVDILHSIPEEVLYRIAKSTLRFKRYVPSRKNKKITEYIKASEATLAPKFHNVLYLDEVFQTEDRFEIENILKNVYGLDLARFGDYIKWDGENNLEFCLQVDKFNPPLANIIRAASQILHSKKKYILKLIHENCSIDIGLELEKLGAVHGIYESSLSHSDLRQVDQSILMNTFRFDWQKGDLLLLNNRKITHGREHYFSARNILVTMGFINSNQTH